MTAPAENALQSAYRGFDTSLMRPTASVWFSGSISMTLAIDVLVERCDERQQRDDREDRRDQTQDDREEDARVPGAVDLGGLVDRLGNVLKNPYMRNVFTPSAPPR